MIEIKKVLKILFMIIGIIGLTIFLFKGFFKKNTLNKVFWINNYGILFEDSTLMEPELEKNEIVVIKKLEEYDLEDIIVYKNFNNNLLIRRIVQIDEYSFIAKGDNCQSVEPIEVIAAIEGKVIYHSKKLGRILRW